MNVNESRRKSRGTRDPFEMAFALDFVFAFFLCLHIWFRWSKENEKKTKGRSLNYFQSYILLEHPTFAMLNSKIIAYSKHMTVKWLAHKYLWHVNYNYYSLVNFKSFDFLW